MSLGSGGHSMVVAGYCATAHLSSLDTDFLRLPLLLAVVAASWPRLSLNAGESPTRRLLGLGFLFVPICSVAAALA